MLLENIKIGAFGRTFFYFLCPWICHKSQM